jgi:hypothetical protein
LIFTRTLNKGKKLSIKCSYQFIKPLIIADIGEVVVVKLDGGKQMHCPAWDVISCKHEHNVLVQFVVKQPTKFGIININIIEGFPYVKYN